MKADALNSTIVKFLSSKDLVSFKKVYEHYFKILCMFAYGYLKDKGEVEDIVQDVFVNLWEKDLNIRQPEKLPAYLYSMVRTRCLNQIRGDKVRSDYAIENKNTESWERDIQHSIIKAEVYEEISKSLDKLPPKSREVFELGYLTQLREQDIADRLGITLDTVKSHKKRAKQILRNELQHLFSLIIILGL